jgi:hypothetical protein
MWKIGEAVIAGLDPDPQMEEDNAQVVVPACGDMAVLVCSPLTERTQWKSGQFSPVAFRDMHTTKTAYCSCCTRVGPRRTGVQDGIS